MELQPALQNDRKVENTAIDFDREKMLFARRMSWDALHDIAAKIRPGMLEKEAMEIAENVLTTMGCTRKWHRTWIRFGVNSMKTYGNLSEPDTALQENDIFFLDMGPVFNGYEGDVGKTFSVGNDPEKKRCADDVKIIFDEVKAAWRDRQLKGVELYAFAEECAKRRGWVLNFENSNGHRLSEFPHMIYYKGSIQSLDFTPSPLVWVLEIQIRHPKLPFGAFYEDLLLD